MNSTIQEIGPARLTETAGLWAEASGGEPEKRARVHASVQNNLRTGNSHGKGNRAWKRAESAGTRFWFNL